MHPVGFHGLDHRLKAYTLIEGLKWSLPITRQ